MFCLEILFQPTLRMPQHLVAHAWNFRGLSPTRLFSFFFLKPSVNRQLSIEATEELWPGLLSGMFQSLHCLLWASRCHPSGQGLSFPLPPPPPKLRARPIKIVQTQLRHLKPIRAPAAWRLLWQDKGVIDHTRPSLARQLHAPCQAHIGSSKTLSPFSRPPPSLQDCRADSSACLLCLSYPPMVQINLQEPRSCLWIIPKGAFHMSSESESEVVSDSATPGNR